MKIIVYQIGTLSWYWGVRSGTRRILECPTEYLRKDAAITAANNFAKNIRRCLPEVVVLD